MRSINVSFLTMAACLAVPDIFLGKSLAQVRSPGDFDIERFEPAPSGEDGVNRPAAVEQIVNRTNEFRRQHRLPSLRTNKKLAESATDFAEFMARTDRYGHQADGRQPAQRVAAHEYDHCLVAENIAQRYNSAGYETSRLAQVFVQGWIDSPGHRENMLDPDVTEIGAGLAHSDESGRYYAVQLFGRPKSEAIELEVANQSKTEVEYDLADTTFVIGPRQVRMHARCRASELVVRLPNQATKTVLVKSKASYTIHSGADGELELVARRGTGPNE
jgi:uncharacterized protein YkwD